MAVSTQLEIAILAANHLGEEDTGGALSDSSSFGVNRLINERVDAAARWLLVQHDWQFSRKRTIIRTPADQSTISSGNTATPSVFTTSSAHGLAVDDLVRMSDIAGPTELDDKDFLVNTVPLTTTFTLKENTTDQDVVTASATLTAGTVRKKPFFNWEYAYDVPSDNLKVLVVDQNTVDWDYENNKILSDNINIEVEYTHEYDFSTNGYPDENFNEVLALRLAWEVSVVINQDENKRATLKRMLDDAMKKARFHDASQRGRITYTANDFERSRLNSSRYNDMKTGKLF